MNINLFLFTANEQYQCVISHDLKVASWRPLNSLGGYQQNCDSFGYVPVVKNNYVFYKIMISGTQLKEVNRDFHVMQKFLCFFYRLSFISIMVLQVKPCVFC